MATNVAKVVNTFASPPNESDEITTWTILKRWKLGLWIVAI